MFKRLWDSEWTGAFGALISCLWEAFLLIGPPIGIGPHDRKPYLVWGGVALVLCAVQSFSALRRKNRDLTEQLQKIDEAKPRIKPKEPAAHRKIVHHSFFNKRTGEVIFSEDVPFLCVAFRNDPPNPFPNSVAKGVRAFIDFTPKEESNPTLSIDGRWADSSQPPAYNDFESKSSLLETSFGLGESHVLDIAYISGTNGKCYAWNNENYENYDNQYVTPKHLLSADNYQVQIRLRGEFVDETFNFTFAVTDGNFEFTQPSRAILAESKHGL